MLRRITSLHIVAAVTLPILAILKGLSKQRKVYSGCLP